MLSANIERCETFTQDIEQCDDSQIVADTEANCNATIYTSSYGVDQAAGFGSENWYTFAPTSVDCRGF